MKGLLRIFIRIILCIVLFNGCCSHKYTRWQRNVDMDNLSFAKLRYSLNHQDTTCIIAYLKADAEINAYPCKAGWIHFTKEWEPTLFCIYKDHSINTVELKAGTWVMLRPGNPCFSAVFPDDTLIEDYKCKGGGGLKGIQTTFYPSGKLLEFFTDENITIDSITCKGGIFNSIKLHENGKLKSCTLCKGITVDDKIIKQGTVLHTDTTGKIMDNE